MNRRHRGNARKEGVAMVAFVLVIAIVGVLAGLGRLKAHENAVKRRLERTWQIEKMLATRDALSIANTALKGSQQLSYTNEFPSSNFGDDIVAVIEPIKPVDEPNMSSLDPDVNDENDLGWKVFRNSTKVGVVPVTNNAGLGDGGDGLYFEFSAPMAATNFAYRAAVVRKAKLPWFESEFGYLYTLDIGEFQNRDHIGKLRLYLIGLTSSDRFPTPHPWAAHDQSELQTIADEFDYVLEERPWICMELQPGGGDSEVSRIPASRSIIIHDFNGKGESGRFTRTDVTSNTDDKIVQPGGFLISSTAFCGFGENADRVKLFSRRWDFTREVTYGTGHIKGFDAHSFTNAFQEGAIAIECEFPTNAPSASSGVERRSLTVDSFVMREPLTYAVRAFNPKVTTEKGRDVVTWIFQTREPAVSRGTAGKQCILDTFGREPASLILERKGVTPE